MNDRPNEHGGSRWEPAPTPPDDEQALGAEAEQFPAGGASADEGGAAAASDPADGDRGGLLFSSTRQEADTQEAVGRRFTWRGRGPLVALAAGIVALSGVGGYALGNAGSETDQVGLVGNQTPGNGQLPGGGTPGGGTRDGENGELQGVPPRGHDGDGRDWGDREGDGDGRRHHGWGPGTPPDGDRMPAPPHGSYPGTTPDGTTSQGRET